MASQPSEVSIARTPDNQQTRDVECFPMDIDVDIEFDPAKQAGLYQSKHAPRAPRSEPVRTRSRAAASSQASSTPSIPAPTPATIRKRRKTAATGGDSEVSWNPPSSSLVLAEKDSNGSVVRKTSKPTAPGKENRMKRKHLDIDSTNPATRGNRQTVKSTRSATSNKRQIFNISRDTHTNTQDGENFEVDVSFSDLSSLSNITGSNADAELTSAPSNE
jgi:hypothetical protein